MGDWFSVDVIDDQTYCISEYKHWEQTHCYLMNGSKYSLLIDTGLGISNIYDVVKTLTNKPVIAIATHIHWDHIGGHRYFSNFYVHREELEWISGKYPLPLERVQSMVVDGCDLPSEFCIDEYELFQGTPTKLVEDHERIDLGGRVIEILHTPGHSPGHLCFWEEACGYLFSGDLIYQGTLYANYPSTDPKAYLASVNKIAALAIEKVFPAHHSLDIKPECISRIQQALTVLEKEGKLCHGSGSFQYEDWGIQL